MTGNVRSDGDFNFSTLPMDLQTFAFSLNKLASKLLFVRFDRTNLLAETARAIIDDDQAKIREKYDAMYSDETTAREWATLEAIKDEIETTLNDNMNLFADADAALKKAARAEIDPSLLKLPEDELADLRRSADPENLYDNLQAYHDILNDFITNMVKLCGDLSMTLIRL